MGKADSAPDSVRENVKNDVMHFMKLHSARVGSVLPPKPFAVRTRGYGDGERAEVEQALFELVQEGLLQERERQYYLTQRGYDFLYK